jgi:hypothetical protein
MCLQENIIMATLQANRDRSAFAAKNRLKQSPHNLLQLPAPELAEETQETIFSRTSATAEPADKAYPNRLSELEQRQLLLQLATIYKGWHLVSVQNRPESAVLVAYLVRDRDQDDPILAIREGRAMQIIMDAMGDMKVQHARRKRENRFMHWLRSFLTVVSEN